MKFRMGLRGRNSSEVRGKGWWFVKVVTNPRILQLLGIFWLAEGLLASQSGITTLLHELSLSLRTKISKILITVKYQSWISAAFSQMEAP